MLYGEALIRMWARITTHSDAYHLKDLFVVQLAAARDPDGHIVCHPGKLSRHCQALEGHFPDIHAVSLSLKDIFTYFAKAEEKLFDDLQGDNPLKILRSKIEAIQPPSSVAANSVAASEAPALESGWVMAAYQAKFLALETAEKDLLNDYRAQMAQRFEAELLKSRDALSAEEQTFAQREVANFLSLWFM